MTNPLPLIADAPPPALVPARMINEVLYCERLCYLEWAQGEFADNAFTVEGRLVHERADQPGGALPPLPAAPSSPPASVSAAPIDPAPTDPPASPSPPAPAPRARRKPRAPEPPEDADDLPDEPRPYQARSVWLSSERLGITAKIDIVDGDATGWVLPIEYKRGAAPDLPEGAWLPERAQICAQVLLLRDQGYTCDAGAVYYAASRKRVPIAIDDTLIAATLAAAARARDVAARVEIPPPLTDSPKCKGCSLIAICLPDEVALLRRLEGRDPDPPPDEGPRRDLDALLAPGEPDPAGLFGTVDPDVEIRRLHPARDDKLPLHVQDQGARVSLEGDEIIATARSGARTTVRLGNTLQISLFGNVQITTQALRAVLSRGIPLSFFTSGGWFLGRAVGHESNNVELRVAQHRAAADPAVALGLARGFVASKIRNARTLLRRNAAEPDPVVLGELTQLARKAEQAEAAAGLLGIEGSAARVYFGAFSGMIKGDDEIRSTFDLEGRNRRPPKDPINALLSFAYALLTKDFAVALADAGLDPMLGFYHRPRFGRPALALDLMEEFRPLIADSVVLGAINNQVVGPADFVRAAGSCALGPAGRKRLLQAYERRMDQLVTHPVFGYRISYRRVLEVQARLLGRRMLGEIPAYPEFRTR